MYTSPVVPQCQDPRDLSFLESVCQQYVQYPPVSPESYVQYGVKRGLRNSDGTGVMAGITSIGNVRGYYMEDGEPVPMEGQLIYRGIDVRDIINGFLADERFGFEETAYLLLFGALPNETQLQSFHDILSRSRVLPRSFTEDMILKAPSPDVMNKLARATLALYSYDPDPDNNALEVEMMQAIQLIARYPVIVAHAFACKRHYYDNDSLYLHRPQEELSVAENFLYSIRHNNQFTREEARLLDLCLVLHMEHGGGNNSAFACRTLSSSGTDIYSSIAAAVGALKGPRHGGANIKVVEMFGHIRREVADWSDEEQVACYLEKLLHREAGDGSGLIYGMGHAIYTLSDPRTVILKDLARQVAESKGMMKEFRLFEMVERLSPAIIRRVTGSDKPVCANVDMYSGLVYQMMDIPPELYTPLFAIARIVGWCAHRVEEVYNPFGRIIRPAYKAVSTKHNYIPLAQR